MQVPQVPILARSLFAVAVSPVSSCPSKLGLVLSPVGVGHPCSLPRALELVHENKSLQILLANFFPALGELEDSIRVLISQWQCHCGCSTAQVQLPRVGSCGGPQLMPAPSPKAVPGPSISQEQPHL